MQINRKRNIKAMCSEGLNVCMRIEFMNGATLTGKCGTLQRKKKQKITFKHINSVWFFHVDIIKTANNFWIHLQREINV